MNLIKTAASLVAAAGIWSAPALAAPIAAAGTTDVQVSDAVLGFITTNNITVGLIPDATSPSAGVFSFPITGGMTDPLRITHSGGLSLSKDRDGDANDVEITISDFVVNEPAGFVSATVDGGGSAPLFELGTPQSGDPIVVDLFITQALSDALNMFIDYAEARPDLTGVLFGTATTAPQPAPIPLPAAAPMLLLGAASLAFFRRRRAV